MPFEPEDYLRSLFDAAVERADPRALAPLPLPTAPAQTAQGRTCVVGAGKASAAFAQALEKTMARAGRTIDEGFVICPQGAALPTQTITCFEASHPVPDIRSQQGASHILDLAARLGTGDELIVLLSGGGSSLMALPVAGLSLDEKRTMTEQLLKSGAAIDQINCVRKHLSQIKGGKLARAAAPARVTTLAISDVIGNDPSIIASGPTVSDPSSGQDALAILENYSIAIPSSVRDLLEKSSSEPLTSPGTFTFIATPQDALDAACARAMDLAPEGLQIHNLGCDLGGDAAELGAAHAALSLELKHRGGRHLVISGGEVTCRLPASLNFDTCSGGPNHVYALALLLALQGEPDIYALAADTDGKDGSTSAAGAFATPRGWTKAATTDLSPSEALTSHRSGEFFDRIGAQLVTGPTHTNVNDFRAILITDSPDP